MNQDLRAFIVDDEALSRDELKFLLASGHDDIEVIGESDDADRALAAIIRQRPELVFLDINFDMTDSADRTGLRLAEDLCRLAAPPFLVFATGKPEFAVEAFALHPAHYLVKPFGADQLAAAIDWIRRHRSSVDETAQRLLRQLSAPARIAVRHRQTDRWNQMLWPTAYLRPEQILYLRADGDGTLSVHLKPDPGAKPEILHGVRQTLDHYAAMLAGRRFFLINRSTLVNLDHVRQRRQRPGDTEEYQLSLDGSDDELPISRARLSALLHALEGQEPVPSGRR